MLDQEVPPRHAFWALWRGEQPAVASLFTIIMIQFTAMAMISPVAAFFAINDIGLDSREVGLMMSMQAGIQVVAALGCGRLSDAIGRRVCITACFACGTTSMVLLVFAQSRAELWTATLVQGLMTGFYPISDSYILDSVPVAERARYTGLYGAVFGATFTVGNILGSLLQAFGVGARGIFALGAALSAAAVLYGYWRLEESFAPSKRRPLSGDGWSWGIVGQGLACSWACCFCYGLADGFMSMYPFLIQDLYAWSAGHYSLAMGLVGLSAGLTMLFVFPPLVDRLGSPATLGAGCVAGALAFLLFPRGEVLHVCGLACFMVSVALFNPSVPLVVGAFAGERHLGFASGVGGAARSVAGAFSPALAGHLYAESPDLIGVGSAFFLAGAAAAAGVYAARPMETKPLLETKPQV